MVEFDNFDDVKNFGTIMEYMDFRDKTFWERIGVGGTITANPIEQNGIIYVGSYDKNFYAIDLNGKEKWRFQTGGIIQSHGLYYNGKVLFGSKDRNFYCLGAGDGRLVWKTQLNGPISNGAAEHNGIIYVASENGNLYAVKAVDGSIVWTFKTSYPITTPLIKDGKIYCGYYSQCLYCLNLKGELLWKFNTGGLVSAWPPASDGDIIYFGSWDRNIYAISADGKLKWKFPTKDYVLCPVAEKDRVYFGCLDCRTYCLDSSGKKIWEFKTDEPVSEITIDGCALYMGCYDSKFYALDKKTGREIWNFKTNGVIHCKPLVLDNKIIFGSWDCNLYCVDKEGRLVWKFKTSLGTPSPIEPPQQIEFKRLEVVPSEPEEKKKSDKYKSAESMGDYEADRTTYASGMSKSYISSKKKGYVSSGEF